MVTLPPQRYDQYLTTPRSTITLGKICNHIVHHTPYTIYHIPYTVNSILVASFLSRASYQLLSLCGIYTLPDVDIGGQAEGEGGTEG
ncbi:hypothetical protein EON63_18370, partial [archaeon]